MLPYEYLPIHPALKDIVSLIAVMHIDFSASGMSPVYHFPWMNNTHVFFPLCADPLLVKSEGDKDFHAHSAAYFVGPKLINDTADFGRRRDVLGITFKAGVFPRLMRIPANELTNVDIDATYIFGNSLKETEMKLRDAKSNAEMLGIVEVFLFRIVRSMEKATSFDRAIDELLKRNGNLTVETLAGYACKSTRQLERQCVEKLGMAPRLFARLIRFGNAFAMKEVNPHLNWTEIAYRFGYYDQMHLIRDFKTFTGATPGSLNLRDASSTKMMAVLHGVY